MKRDIGKETEDQIKMGKDRGGIEGDRQMGELEKKS
jgi:hypothetical protein